MTDHALIEELKATIASQQSKIEHLCRENATNAKTARKNIDYFNRCSNEKDREIADLRSKVADAEAWRDWCYDAHNAMLDARDDENPTPARDQFEARDLEKENLKLKREKDKLRSEKAELEEEIIDFKWNIGYYITALDLAKQSLRVYKCWHDQLEDVRQGEHETIQHRYGLVATEFFELYKDDPAFIEQYQDARQHFLNHHRAHEQVEEPYPEVIANSASQLKEELLQIDECRDLTANYA